MECFGSAVTGFSLFVVDAVVGGEIFLMFSFNDEEEDVEDAELNLFEFGDGIELDCCLLPTEDACLTWPNLFKFKL